MTTGGYTSHMKNNKGKLAIILVLVFFLAGPVSYWLYWKLRLVDSSFLDGQWQAITAIADGREEIPDATKAIIWHFDQGNLVERVPLVVTSNGTDHFSGRYRERTRSYLLYSDSEKFLVDLECRSLTGGMERNSGILSLDNDRLSICYNNNGQRPRAFESPKGSGNVLYVFQRVN